MIFYNLGDRCTLTLSGKAARPFSFFTILKTSVSCKGAIFFLFRNEPIFEGLNCQMKQTGSPKKIFPYERMTENHGNEPM